MKHRMNTRNETERKIVKEKERQKIKAMRK